MTYFMHATPDAITAAARSVIGNKRRRILRFYLLIYLTY